VFQQWEGFNPAYLSYFMELAKAFHHSLSKPDYISAQAILRKMISMLQKEDRDKLMEEYNKMRDKITIDVTMIEKSDGLSSIKTAAKVEAISHELLQVFEAVMDILHRDDAFKLKYHLVEGAKE
jgi:uncharacterized protein (DUF885 family)